jgi:hypothetical protein
MDVTELVAAVQSYLDNQLVAPVKVASGDDRPSPAVEIEGWDVSHINQANTNYITSQYDENGVEIARVYRVPYDVRLSFMVRENDPVSGSRLQDNLKQELYVLEDRPHNVDDRLSRVMVEDGGGVSYQFQTPAESEFTQAATFTSSVVYTMDDYDNIEDIEFTVEVIQTPN